MGKVTVIRLKNDQNMIKNALSLKFYFFLLSRHGARQHICQWSGFNMAIWASRPKARISGSPLKQKNCCCAVTKHSFKLDIGRHVEYPKPCALSETWHIIIYVQFDLYCIIGFYVFLPGHHKTIAMHEFTNKTREKTPVETLKPLLTDSADE